MHTAGSLIVLLAAFATAGCVMQEPRPQVPRSDAFVPLQKKPCPGSQCDVLVKVVSCVVTVDADVTEVVDASPTVRSTRMIRWVIVDSPDYRFSNDPNAYGIVILDFDPTREFEKPVREDTTFTLKFNNTFKRAYPGYKYAINVQHVSGTPCRALDPWVVN